MHMPSTLPTFFFFNDTATTEIYTLSLHDALPISRTTDGGLPARVPSSICMPSTTTELTDRKSTRLNSSHQIISYAVFCLKKKKVMDQTNVARRSASVAAQQDASKSQIHVTTSHSY